MFSPLQLGAKRLSSFNSGCYSSSLLSLELLLCSVCIKANGGTLELVLGKSSPFTTRLDGEKERDKKDESFLPKSHYFWWERKRANQNTSDLYFSFHFSQKCSIQTNNFKKINHYFLYFLFSNPFIQRARYIVLVIITGYYEWFKQYNNYRNTMDPWQPTSSK